jgi:hypothetical protein
MWRKVKKDPKYHISANLLKGAEENYRWLGVDWPENQYLLIGLSGDADIKTRKPMQTGVVNGWRCRYDIPASSMCRRFFRTTMRKRSCRSERGVLIIATSSTRNHE